MHTCKQVKPKWHVLGIRSLLFENATHISFVKQKQRVGQQLLGIGTQQVLHAPSDAYRVGRKDALQREHIIGVRDSSRRVAKLCFMLNDACRCAHKLVRLTEEVDSELLYDIPWVTPRFQIRQTLTRVRGSTSHCVYARESFEEL